jgi:hypothetical protein
MARQTIYVVQAFVRDNRGRLAAEPAIPARNEDDAKRRALGLKDKRAGVVAFARTGDIETGEYEDAVIIAKYGDVPGEEQPD